jgi:hypothetical protein
MSWLKPRESASIPRARHFVDHFGRNLLMIIPSVSLMLAFIGSALVA